MIVNFNKLPEQPEEFVNNLGRDDALLLLNNARTFLMENPEDKRPELLQFLIMLTRKIRASRENSVTGKKAAPKVPNMALKDLLADL